jgi:spore germination cell wall hydrolase CwlJ-like protein
MLALRTRPKGARSASFGLSAFCVALAPTSLGYQDLAALIARQPAVSERWREHLIASPFGTIHAATFSLPRPLGTAMPEPPGFQRVNFDPGSIDVSRNEPQEPLVGAGAQPMVFPVVNRRLKGDRLPMPMPKTQEQRPPEQVLPQLQPIDSEPQPATPPAQTEPVTGPPPGVHLKQAEQFDPRTSEAPAPEPELVASTALDPAGPHSHDDANSLAPQDSTPAQQVAAANSDNDDDAPVADVPPEVPAIGEIDPLEAAHSYVAALSFLDDSPDTRKSRLYFGVGAMGSSMGGLERWAPGAEPVLTARGAADPEIKLAALTPVTPDSTAEGETVAPKGEISGAGRQYSPAQRLGLEGKPRAKAEKCLADAIYFEARGESVRGQEAVAQVVMNRVFSGFYPNDVCGVVYQNANRHLACQFTFACDGKPEKVDEPDMWAQAKRISKETLDGKIWLAEVGHATHYHAYWVHPSWVHEMKKMYKLGVHTFYRPRAWGSGDDAPVWGNVPGATEEAKPEAAVVKPEAAADGEPTAKL